MTIVRDMFRFRQRIPLNMQTTMFSAAEYACRGFRRQCFTRRLPDHYLLNAFAHHRGSLGLYPGTASDRLGLSREVVRAFLLRRADRFRT